MRLTTVGKFIAVAVAVAGSCLASSASAALFYNETFSYPDGNLVGNGGWANHSGTGTFIQVSSGTVSTTAGAGSREDANRTTGSTLGQGQTWYAGFDLTEIAPSGTLAEDYFASFLQGTSNFTSAHLYHDSHGRWRLYAGYSGRQQHAASEMGHRSDLWYEISGGRFLHIRPRQ